MAPTDDTNLSKEVQGDAKRPPASLEETTAPEAKRSRPDEPLDIAQTLGLSGTDRLEVLWTVDEKERWWGAKLLEHDGRTTDDGVSIRTLCYDAWPEGGFPEQSNEDVVFMGKDVLVNYPSEEELSFRVLAEDNSEVVWVQKSDTENVINGILDEAFKKIESSFSKLPRSQQAVLADTIAKKKKKLVDLLDKHLEEQSEKGGQAVVTADDARECLNRAMMDDDN